ncbi:MAG: hypothetical protein Q7S53_02765 [bacterium]|nr:hypothetical protein [bacterium]
MADTSSPVAGGMDNKKSLDYVGILKNAFNIVRHNRYLWYLGILAGTAGSGYGGNFGGSSGRTNSSGDLDVNQVWTEALKWIQAHIVLIIVVSSILLILCIVFTVLSNMAKAGLVHSVDSLSRNEESSFGKAMKFGWHKFWRVFGSGFLIGLAVLGIIILLMVPIVAVLFINPLASIPIVLIALPVMFFVTVISGIIYQYSLRYISLKDEKVIVSIKSGYGLLKRKKKDTALIWLIAAGVSMVFGIALVFAILLVALILFLLGLLLFIISQFAGIIYVVVAATAFIVFLFVAGGFISSLVSAYWTLCFKEMIE